MHAGSGGAGLALRGRCPGCGASGVVRQEWCARCGGSGRAPVTVAVRVRIPAGAPRPLNPAQTLAVAAGVVRALRRRQARTCDRGRPRAHPGRCAAPPEPCPNPSSGGRSGARAAAAAGAHP